MSCEKLRPEYHTIDHTTAKRRFYLSAKNLEAVPTIVRFLGRVRCRYYRPADLLAAALKRHGGTEGLRLRRELGLKRRAAALRGVERRNRRLEALYASGAIGMMNGMAWRMLPADFLPQKKVQRVDFRHIVRANVGI
jgi:hypothetical protein